MTFIDVFTVAESFVDLVRRDAPDAVALIAYYGSHATGTATPSSDLDLYYIPDDPEASAGLYRSIVVQGRAFEFWGVPWAFAEKIAAGRHRWSVAPSIIANARLLYHRSDADVERFAELQARIARLQAPESRDEARKLALESFAQGGAPLQRLDTAAAAGDAVGVRWSGAQLIDALLDSLCLHNQTFLIKHWASDVRQLEALQAQPPGLTDAIRTITTAADLDAARRAAHQLSAAVRRLLRDAAPTLRDDTGTSRVFAGYYAAVREYVNKVLAACERHDSVRAAVGAVQMQNEFAGMLAYAETGVPYADFGIYDDYRASFDAHGLPDLMAAMDRGGLDGLAEATRRFDAAVQAFFVSQGLSLGQADDIDGLRKLVFHRAPKT